ncbi:MAG: glycosyl hydrolase family 28-related protein [Rikenellaceae bacterium]
MKLKLKAFALAAMIALAAAVPAEAAKKEKGSNKEVHLDLKSHYVEKIDYKGLTKCAVKDYGIKSDGSAQSAAMQKALDDLSAQGGGILNMPAGVYAFNGVCMRSNVHIVVDSGVTFKLAKGESKAKGKAKEGGVIFLFSYSEDDAPRYVENCSIRSKDGKQYKVDYREFSNDGTSVRFIICRMVKNFYIADADIYDNYTVHCGIIFVPAKTEGADKWELSRPTHGQIRNCSIHNANSGYGLCQLHGAQGLFFEDIFSNGGVTLRLESGAGGPYAGVFDIQARNVSSEGGRASVMMNPHCTHNGTAKIDGVSSVSSSATVLIHGGFIDRKHKNDPNATVGTYANDCEIVNIHGVYGEEAQVDDKEVYICDPVPGYEKKFRENGYGNKKSLTGPSYAVVFDSTNGEYTVKCQNVTGDGFPGEIFKYEHDLADRMKRKWEILKSLPVYKARGEGALQERFGASKK